MLNFFWFKNIYTAKLWEYNSLNTGRNTQDFTRYLYVTLDFSDIDGTQSVKGFVNLNYCNNPDIIRNDSLENILVL